MLYTAELPEKTRYDVAVCGGGCAGFTAALQAARLGARTCIIEKNGMLGGTMTAGGNPDIALFNAGVTPVIRGIGWEFVTRLAEMGYAAIPEFRSGIPHSKQGVRVNIPMAAHLLDVMCGEAGVDVYLMTVVSDVRNAEEGYNLICAGKEGLFALCAKRVADCTGDADVCALAGADFLLGGEDGELQPGTLGFCMRMTNPDSLDSDALRAAHREALESGELLPADIWPRGATPELALRSGGINVNHIAVDTGYAQNRTQIETEGRASVARLAAFYRKYLPRCGNVSAGIADICCETALRETRRVVCETNITAEDYVNGRVYEDAVCHSYYPIDLHRHDPSGNTLYNIGVDERRPPTIPYSALLPRGTENLLTAGRCIGGDRLAQSAYRVKASCMAMGQAAGAAAALSVLHRFDLRQPDLGLLRRTLREHGAIVCGH